MNVRMLAFLLLGAGACVDGSADSGMRIIGNVAPSGACSVDSASNTFQDDGLIDPDSRFGYVFTPAVINELVTVEGEAVGPKTIYVTAARIHIEFYDSEFDGTGNDVSLLDFQVPMSGVIEPNGGTAAFSFEIVPPDLLSALGVALGPPDPLRPPRTTLDVHVQMVGERAGSEITSKVFRYPVEVCKGCTVVDVGMCENLPQGYVASTGGSCNTLQDGLLECCDNFTVCPATPPEPQN